MRSMLCPNCGASIGTGYARFCPRCGYALNSYSTPVLRHYVPEQPAPAAFPPAKKKNTGKTAAVIVAALLLSVLLVSVAASGIDTPSEEIEIQTLTNDTYFELSGDFLLEKGIFTVGLDDDGNIAFTLTDKISSEHTYYEWKLFDRDHMSSSSTARYMKYNGDTLKKTEPVLYYIGEQKLGQYDISVDCYVGSPGEYVYSETYSGTVSYIGNITKDYSWTYLGKRHSVQTMFSYDEYREYKNTDTNGRMMFNYNRIIPFITSSDPAVEMLAGSLREAYGGDANDQGFAAFVLSFIQLCFDYPPYTNSMEGDMYMYGQEEYFAYPLETIFYDMGDCEDTSILAAALYKSLGYEAGVFILPGHAVAAVGLDSYEPGSYSRGLFEVMSYTFKGTVYYGCETTVDDFQRVGIIDIPRSSTAEHPYSWYLGKDGYGLYGAGLTFF